jgi:hypothetical protein
MKWIPLNPLAHEESIAADLAPRADRVRGSRFFRSAVCTQPLRRLPRLCSCTVIAAVSLLACGGGAEELDVEIVNEEGEVTFSWDGRAVHVVEVSHQLNGAERHIDWQLSYTTELPFPPGEPSIVPPVRYGAVVEGAFTIAEPEPLVSGVTYRVTVDVLGWGDTCYEVGIDDEPDPAARCSVAVGRPTFIY